MAATYPEYIWQNGRIKPWAEATVHVMAHALHYGSSVFEGIRSYETPQGPAIFRLGDHLKRLYMSAKIYDIAIPYTIDELAAACREVILKNGLTKAYLRPVAFRGLGGFGLSAETPPMSPWRPGKWALILARACSKPVSMPACPPGTGWLPTPFRPAPRRAAITFRATHCPRSASARFWRRHRAGLERPAQRRCWRKPVPRL